MIKKMLLAFCMICCGAGLAVANHRDHRYDGNKGIHGEPDNPHTVLEEWTYTENFENRDLGAWASYPHWQDLAYDQNFRFNTIIPGDPNLSLVQKVTPYAHADNYAGAQKLLDMFLVPGATLSFRYYLKTQLPAASFKIRFAAGDYGKIDVTVREPALNKWVSMTVGFSDFVRENPSLAGKEKIRIYALAFLAKIPDADPDMPFYLGLDDIVFKGARAVAFRFAEPVMTKLPEYKQYIPQRPYRKGDYFNLSGQWPLDAKKVTLQIASFTDEKNIVYKTDLGKTGSGWKLKPLKLDLPEGLYQASLTAYNGSRQLSETSFTIHIAPGKMTGKHPRLLFDETGKEKILERCKEDRFKPLYDEMPKTAKTQRERVPAKSLVFDLDQFPDEDWLPTWSASGTRLFSTNAALRSNAMAYAFHGDKEAGKYVKDVLVQLAGWPHWSHPWQIKRGRYSDHRMGAWSHIAAEAYDLTYDLMTPDERALIRKAILANIIDAAHKTYVEDDNITAKTSNWLAMIVGGSLMNMAAIFDDGPETENMEPYFTGAMIKFYEFIKRVTDPIDGSWGEGKDYNAYSFMNMGYSLTSLDHVFNIDLTAPLVNTYNEYIWAGLIKDKRWFQYGDASGGITPPTGWAFLLGKRKEPRLAWYYNYFKEKESWEDVLFDTKPVAPDEPFDESPVKVFHGIGTTVFKSGWEKDDLSFVMRTGPFYNHQHLDQGSFWLADKGEIFIGEQDPKKSDYYDDPLYQPWVIQPAAHSTILIDGDPQSQRTGDHRGFAPGFDDYAFIASFLDGKKASFSSGDIGRLYWDKVKSLRRNVLFIKPGIILMTDMAEPAGKNVSLTLQYPVSALEEIKAGPQTSTISKKNATLHILHLSPASVVTKAVETPHYLKTLQTVKPLKKEGMLTLTAQTRGQPLVIANLFTATASGLPDIKTTPGDGFVSGSANGTLFAFNTRPGKTFNTNDKETDAVALTWDGEQSFVALATLYKESGRLVLQSDSPVTFEYAPGALKYYRGEAGKITMAVSSRPSSVTVNGAVVKKFVYDGNAKTIKLDTPAGEGTVHIR